VVCATPPARANPRPAIRPPPYVALSPLLRSPSPTHTSRDAPPRPPDRAYRAPRALVPDLGGAPRRARRLEARHARVWVSPTRQSEGRRRDGGRRRGRGRRRGPEMGAGSSRPHGAKGRATESRVARRRGGARAPTARWARSDARVEAAALARRARTRERCFASPCAVCAVPSTVRTPVRRRSARPSYPGTDSPTLFAHQSRACFGLRARMGSALNGEERVGQCGRCRAPSAAPPPDLPSSLLPSSPSACPSLLSYRC
jgi:hypothetical protein